MKPNVRTPWRKNAFSSSPFSRARTHLQFYQPCFYANGDKRSPSKLLAKLFSRLMHETASPPTVPLAARRPKASAHRNHLHAGLGSVRSTP